MTSCVYFLQLQPFGPVKIGYTTAHPAMRVKALQQTSPHILKWIGFFMGGRKDEVAAHQRLVASKLRAEWFHPTREVLDFIEEKSPDFCEKKFRDIVFMEAERALVKSVIPRWRNSTLVPRDRIVAASGYDHWLLNKWLNCDHLPDPVKARKAADCAAQILAEAAQ